MSTEELLQRMQTARERLMEGVNVLVKAAEALGESPRRTHPSPVVIVSDGDLRPFPVRSPHQFVPWEGGDDACFALVDGVRCGWPKEAHAFYPCSSTCTHDDAAKPGHTGRVKERSEEFSPETGIHRVQEQSFDEGAEAMRAACWEATEKVLESLGWNVDGGHLRGQFKAAIEGATP